MVEYIRYGRICRRCYPTAVAVVVVCGTYSATPVVVGSVGPVGVSVVVSAVDVSVAPVDVGPVGPGVVATPVVVDSAAVVVTSVAVD